MNESVSWSSHF